MTAKERYRIKILEYIANWDNDFPSRTKMAVVCGVTKDALRKHFTPDEYTEIENTGLGLRKKNSAPPRADVYASMLLSAKDGVVPAQKEFLDRTEGKVVDYLQVGMDEATLNIILATLPPGQAEKTKKALIALVSKKTKP